jgi:hypothetical protein
MQRWAFLLSLLAALTGTPLRQAEAASDLARSLAGFAHDADIEAPDGGVGDDSGVGTLTVTQAPTAADAAPDADIPFLPPSSPWSASPAAERGLWERVWWPQSPPALRFAWLQVFRF